MQEHNEQEIREILSKYPTEQIKFAHDILKIINITLKDLLEEKGA